VKAPVLPKTTLKFVFLPVAVFIVYAAISVFSNAASSNALVPTMSDKPCAPLGDPKDGKRYKGNDAFYLCKEGEHFKADKWGPDNVELYISCHQSTARAGVKWHIWCNSDASHCSCSREGFISGGTICCEWAAGDHCTNDEGSGPGEDGCATW
jgi:hypothetical protein